MRDYDDDYDDDDRPSRRSRRSRSGERPGKVQAIAIMTLIGGIMATLVSLAVLTYIGVVGVLAGVGTFGVGCLCCLWPGPYYGLTAGILAIVKGSQLLGERAQSLPAPRGTAILLIINIVNFDVVSLVLGIIVLVFCSDPEVEEFYRG
jgi:hypothetical protein